jgi:hypothetical protein
MSKKISSGQRRSGAAKDLACRDCGEIVTNVDSNTVSCVCWRCVTKMLNPHSRIISDLPREEWTKALKQDNKNNGRSENPATES